MGYSRRFSQLSPCDAALAAALSAYGNVQSVHEPVFKGRPGVGTGVRVARVEMKKPIPNFLSVQGFNVMCDYRGVQKLCSRFRLAGHIAKDCVTPRCPRCNVYGHATEGCTEACRRCSGNHATADCVGPKSFAAAAAGEQESSDVSPPALASQEQVPALGSESETLTSGAESQAESQDIRDLPPPSEMDSPASCVLSKTGDSSSETHEEHSESPVSAPSSDHASCSSDTGGSSGSSDAPRAPMGRGTRAAGRPEVPLTSPNNSTAVAEVRGKRLRRRLQWQPAFAPFLRREAAQTPKIARPGLAPRQRGGRLQIRDRYKGRPRAPRHPLVVCAPVVTRLDGRLVSWITVRRTVRVGGPLTSVDPRIR
ncbi:hypothetical protein HPB50_028275 [Hyalomma asiaticum]|nr:hypothetical protein HPB50_028275 [Hyalomma asiaticum]